MTDITEWREEAERYLTEWVDADFSLNQFNELLALLQQVDRESRADQTTKLIQMLLSTKTNDFNVYFDKLKAEKAALTQKGK